MTIVSTREIAVTGMTCDHCANAVRAEISRLPGDGPLREAVEEAGYELAG